MEKFFRSRSKSRSRQTEAPGQLPPQPYRYLKTPLHTGVPEYQAKTRTRSNSASFAVPLAANDRGVLYSADPAHHQHRYSRRDKENHQIMAYSPQMIQPPTHYFSQGHVVYNHIPQKSGYESSPQSLYLDSHGRGRPRSNTSSTARDKFIMSSNAPQAAHIPLAGYVPGPASHEAPKSSGGIFGTLVNAVRSRSKSRERDALFSSGPPKPTVSSRTSQGDSRGRPVYDLKRQKEMLRDVDAEIARRLEKDLRTQDLEDPYRSIRRDRSRSFDSTRSRERTERRHRDVDPDVLDNTRYNAKALTYAPERPSPVNRMRSDQHYNSGYHTDAQTSMLRRSSTTAAHPKSSRSAYLPVPKGWYNRRGDQLVGQNSVIRQPLDREYLPCFAHYPPPGQGFADSLGNIIDMEGRLIKRVG